MLFELATRDVDVDVDEDPDHLDEALELPPQHEHRAVTARDAADAAAMTVSHVVREAAGEPEGAFVLVHGRGSDEHDLAPLFDVFDPRQRLVGVAPGGPLALAPGGKHWYAVPRVGYPDPATFAEGFGALTSFLDGWLAGRGIGWERTIMGGFSQGAVMAYATALGAGRPRPLGLLAMSGFIPTVEGWSAELESRRGLPVCVAHGTQDQVIAVDFGREAVERLRAAGLDVAEHVSTAAHHVDPRAVPAIADWVQARL